MLLRILLIAIAVFAVLSLFQKVSPQAAERAARRRHAWRVALRKTALSLGAFAFLGVTAFAGFHAWRYHDSTAAIIALAAAPLALVLGVLSYRVDRVGS